MTTAQIANILNEIANNCIQYVGSANYSEREDAAIAINNMAHEAVLSVDYAQLKKIHKFSSVDLVLAVEQLKDDLKISKS